MKEFVNKIVVFINSLSNLQQFCILAFSIILTCCSFYFCVKKNYNSKKNGIKIGPIILTIIFLAITIFIINCF